MKIKTTSFVIALFIASINAIAQVAPCNNIGFEDSTFTFWTGATGNCSNYPTPTVWTPGIVSAGSNAAASNGNAQHTILTDPNGYDPNVGGTILPYLAPGGGGVSVRLGNSDVNAGTEKLDYQMNVTPTNAAFTFMYAVVLENASGHTPTESPRFEMHIYDHLGSLLSGPCASLSFDVTTSDPAFLPFGSNTGFYKNWTYSNIDLAPYVGQTITIEFVTQDCTLGGHYGYAYIDATCSGPQAQQSFCPNDTVITLTAPVGIAAYQWYDTTLTAIAGGTTNTLQVSNPVAGNQYIVVMQNATGCGASLTVTLVPANLVLHPTTQPESCAGANNGGAYVNASGAYGLYYYTWIDLSTSANVTQAAHPDSLLNVGAGTYYVSVQSSGGCYASDTVVIGTLSTCFVWPGDTDANHIVDNTDLLPIGLYYAQTGAARSSMSNVWQAYPVADWGTLQSSGADIKNADCNGDGVIDNNDTLAVNLNFNLTHAITSINNEVRLSAPDLYFVTSNTNYNPGDIVDVEIWAGNATTPVSNLYGIAFNINYEASLVQSGTESMNYPVSWLGTPGADAIKMTKTDALASTAYGAETRIDHTNESGFGKIADFKFRVNNFVATPAYLNLSFTGYKTNNAAGAAVIFNTVNDSVLINAGSVGINQLTSDNLITISPNPFTSQTTITFAGEQKNTTIKIIDVVGKEIKTISFTGKQCVIEKDEMKPGIYFLQITDEKKNVMNKKVVIQ